MVEDEVMGWLYGVANEGGGVVVGELSLLLVGRGV